MVAEPEARLVAGPELREGMVLELRAGDRVPADLVLLAADQVLTEESGATGGRAPTRVCKARSHC